MTAYKKTPGPAGADGVDGTDGQPGPVGPVGTGFRRTYAALDGTTATAWSTAHAAALDLTTKMTYIVAVIPTDLTPALDEAVVSSNTAAGNQRGAQIIHKTTGAWQFQASQDGTAGTTITCTSPLPPAEFLAFEGPLYIKVVADATAGAGGNAIATFYYAFDDYVIADARWTLIGSGTATLPGPWHASTGATYVGRNANGVTSLPFIGHIYKASIYDASDVLVAEFDAQSLDPATPSAHYADPTLGQDWVPAASAVVGVSSIVNADLVPVSFTADRIADLPTSSGSPGLYPVTDSALGNNSSDGYANAIAVQAALPPTGSLGIGGGVGVPTGHYRYSAAPIILNKVRWYGTGRDSVVISPHSTFPATKVATATANISASGTTLTLDDTSETSFASTDAGATGIGRIACIPGAGPGGRMLKARVTAYTGPLSVTIATAATSTVSHGAAYIATPLFTLGSAGAFGTGLENLQVSLTGFANGFGVWTEFCQEQSGLRRVAVVGAVLCSICTSQTGGAQKNWSLREVESLGSTSTLHTNADMVSLFGGMGGIDLMTVVANGARSCIAIDGGSGTVANLHCEGSGGSTEGLIIGEASACAGLAVLGAKGHVNLIDQGVRIAQPPTGHNVGINLAGIRRGTTTSSNDVITDEDSLQPTSPGDMDYDAIASYLVDGNRNVTSAERHLFGGVSV